jgi:YggT family protein
MGIVCLALSVYWLILIARIILSWVTMAWSPPPAVAPVMRVIYDLTEPLLGLFRRYIPPVGALDLSPLFIFIIIGIVQRSIC